MSDTPDRIDLAPGLNISRLVCGLWQVADLEKDGDLLDPARNGSGALRPMPKPVLIASTWPTIMVRPS